MPSVPRVNYITKEQTGSERNGIKKLKKRKKEKVKKIGKGKNRAERVGAYMRVLIK